MRFYNYFRSSASYRLRIALALKEIEIDQVQEVDLRTDEQKSKIYQRVVPSGLVPALQIGEKTFGQSIALIEWLDVAFPEPRLIPEDPVNALAVREVALAIACDIHPLNNLRVLKYLKSELDHSDEETANWYSHWVKAGFDGVEQRLKDHNMVGPFAFGERPTLADVCIVPQVFNAKRFNVDLSSYPLICGIANRCNELDAFKFASPEISNKTVN